MGGISLAVFSIVDLSIPAVDFGRRHAEQDRHAERWPGAFGWIGIVHVDPAGPALPRHNPPESISAFLYSNACIAVGHQPFAGRIGGECRCQAETNDRRSEQYSSHCRIQNVRWNRDNF
jgi:hypothetical protein